MVGWFILLCSALSCILQTYRKEYAWSANTPIKIVKKIDISAGRDSVIAFESGVFLCQYSYKG